MRLRTGFTLVVLLALVAGAGWYGWAQFSEPVDRNPFADPDACIDEDFAVGSRLRARQVQVNVLNAGNRDGLADDTLERLRRQGFLPGVAANAPSRIQVPSVAIYDADPRSAEVRLVRSQFNGAVSMRDKPDFGEELGEGIDVVVGSGFLGVDRAARPFLRVRSAEEVCVPPTREGRPGRDRDGRDGRDGGGPGGRGRDG